MTEFDESLTDALDLTEVRGASMAFAEAHAESLGISEPPFQEVDGLEDDLDLTEEVLVVFPEDVDDDLDLSEELTDTHSMGVFDSLALTEQFASSVAAVESALDSLALTEDYSAILVRPGDPLGESLCAEEYLATRNISRKEDVEFSLGLSSVVLPAPTFGNVDSIDTQSLVRKNRGGEYQAFRDAAWVTLRTVKVRWVGLKDSEIADLLAFLSDTAGQQVTYRDHENIERDVVVTTPIADVVRDVGADCATEVALEMLEVPG